MGKNQKALLSAFAAEFKQAGFKKKARTWHRINQDTVEVFNIQCSQYEESYYFNAGIYLRALGSLEAPLERECHIRDRIPNLAGHGREAWDRWRVLSCYDPPPSGTKSIEWTDLDPETRTDALTKLIAPLALNWFGSLRELSGLKRQLALPYGERPFFVHRDTWAVVGLPFGPHS